MSTQAYYTSNEILDFISHINQAEGMGVVGYDGGDYYGVGPYFSCYVLFEEDQANNLIKKFIQLFKRFSEIKNEPWTWFSDIYYERMIPADKFSIGTLEQDVLSLFDKDGYLTFNASTSIDSEYSSAVWGLEFKISFRPEMRYACFKVNYRHAWYKANVENQKTWHQYMLDCLNVLQPMHAYSGFEIATAPLGVVGAEKYTSLEKIASEYYYGLDIDHPLDMSFHDHFDTDGYVNYSVLGAGIKTPVWQFLLSPHWLEKLGKSIHDIKIYFKDFPKVIITEINYSDAKKGVWIRLGKLSLYPVEEGIPTLLIHANKLIKPIRCDYLKLTIFDAWEDDPNPYFDYETSLAWMRRFDVDENIETLDIKEVIAESLRLYPDEICPKTGWWDAPNLMGKKQFIKQGEKAIGPHQTEGGNLVIWYWREINNR